MASYNGREAAGATSSRRGMAVIGVIFQMIAIVFVLVAFATDFAALGASPMGRRITNWVIYACGVAALASVMLADWFLFRPPV